MDIMVKNVMDMKQYIGVSTVDLRNSEDVGVLEFAIAVSMMICSSIF